MRARAVRGRCDGRGRRLCAHGGQAGFDPSAFGPGLANGLANVHNARRANTPMVNIVGDHATYHKEYEAPLASDVEGVAWPFSDWVRTAADSRSVARDGADAVAAAMAPPGRVATLILPADASWNEADGPAPLPPVEGRAQVAPEAISEAARVLRSGEPAVLFMGGHALREPGLMLAGRIAAKSGARLLAQTLNGVERGRGVSLSTSRTRSTPPYRPSPRRATSCWSAPRRRSPSSLTLTSRACWSPPQCETHTLARPGEDIVGALEALSEELGAPQNAPVQARENYPPPTGEAITLDAAAAAVGTLLPKARSSSTRRSVPLRLSCRGRGARPRTTTYRSPEVLSVSDSRSPPGRR